MSTGLNRVIVIVPLRQPRKQIFPKVGKGKERPTQLKDVLEKFNKVEESCKPIVSPSKKEDKENTIDNQGTDSLKKVARDSPGNG